MVERRVENQLETLARHCDQMVEAWNETHSDQPITVDWSAGSLIGSRARMYRHIDGILTLRYFPLPQGTTEFDRLGFIAGGSLGFTLAQTGINLALAKQSSGGDLGHWCLLDVSENPLSRSTARTNMLARSLAEFMSYLGHLGRGISSLQVEPRALQDRDITGLLAELIQRVN